MRAIHKKLALRADTLRTLSGLDLEGVEGGHCGPNGEPNTVHKRMDGGGAIREGGGGVAAGGIHEGVGGVAGTGTQRINNCAQTQRKSCRVC